jgi:phage-related protein
LPFRATCNTFILKDDSKVRKLVFYKDYYDVFIKNQRSRVQAKIFWTIILIENVEKVPSKYLKYIIGSDGVFEIRILTRNDIFRIFCFFNKQNELVLINGFQKKTQKTPQNEIDKAVKIKHDYENEKECHHP